LARRFKDVFAGQVTLVSLTIEGTDYLFTSIQAIIDVVQPEMLDGRKVEGALLVARKERLLARPHPGRLRAPAWWSSGRQCSGVDDARLQRTCND
jgi:hypothetical protein